MNKFARQGFSAVEVLVTVIVGVVFIGAIAQMYGVVMSDAATVRNRTTASSIAYTQARAKVASVSGTCVTSSSTTTPVANLPPTISMTTAVDCPFSNAGTYANSAVSRVTVTVTYDSPQETVKHVLYSY